MRPVQFLRGSVEAPFIPEPPEENPENGWATRKVVVGCTDRKGIPRARQIKNLQGQLITIDPSPADANLIRGAVLGEDNGNYWDLMEPGATQPASRTWTTTVENFMDECDTKDLQVRARPVLGKRAPVWAKDLLGTRITMIEHGVSTDGQLEEFTVGHIWEKQYYDKAQAFFAWYATQAALHTSFRELSLSHTMTYYQEPMIWQLAYRGDATHRGNPEALWQTNIDTPAYGYSQTKHIAAYERNIDASKSLLVDTHAKNFVFNSPYQFVQNTTPAVPSNATMGTNTAITDALIARAALTNEVVLMNHSLRLWGTNSTYDRMYKTMAASGAPSSFQTINTVNGWWDQAAQQTGGSGVGGVVTMWDICKKAVETYKAISLELAGTSATYLSQERSGSTAQAAGQTKLQLNVEQIEWLNAKMEANYAAFLLSKAA